MDRMRAAFKRSSAAHAERLTYARLPAARARVPGVTLEPHRESRHAMELAADVTGPRQAISVGLRPNRPGPFVTDVEVRMQCIRKELLARFGGAAILMLHRPSRILDMTALLGSFGVFCALVVAIGAMPSGFVWLTCIGLQGLTLTLMGLVNHDLFVHRKVLGDRGSWIGSILFTVPLPMSPTGYDHAHLLHHRFVGTDRDTEIYKQDLNTKGRRLLFCTFFGIKRATAGVWGVPRRPPYLSLRTESPRLHRRLAIESRVQLFSALCIVAAAFMWPRAIIFGYFVPALVLTPVLNTIRILIEHADLEPDNPYHLATFYRTGSFTRLIYLWDSGDCHLIHHVYPAIPYYRISQAVALLRPYFLERGVVERRSYAALIWGWFVRTYPHRTLWPIEAVGRQSPGR